MDFEGLNSLEGHKKVDEVRSCPSLMQTPPGIALNDAATGHLALFEVLSHET